MTTAGNGQSAFIRDLIATATTAFNAGRYVHADRDATWALTQDHITRPDIIEALLIRGRARMGSRRAREAVRDWEAVQSLDPDNYAAAALLEGRDQPNRPLSFHRRAESAHTFGDKHTTPMLPPPSPRSASPHKLSGGTFAGPTSVPQSPVLGPAFSPKLAPPALPLDKFARPHSPKPRPLPSPRSWTVVLSPTSVPPSPRMANKDSLMMPPPPSPTKDRGRPLPGRQASEDTLGSLGLKRTMSLPKQEGLAGRIEVNRRDTGTFMGYVRDKPSSDGNFKLTTDMVQALTIVTPLPATVTFNIDIAGSNISTLPHLGWACFRRPWNLCAGNGSFAYLTRTEPTAIESTPTPARCLADVKRAESSARVESATWGADSRNQLTAQWVNPDGTKHPNDICYWHIDKCFYLTGDFSEFVKTHANAYIVDFTIV